MTSFLDTVMPGLGGVAEPEVLERVEHLGDRGRAELLHELVDERVTSRFLSVVLMNE